MDLPLDLERSTIDLQDYCLECGTSGIYKILGAEEPPREALIDDRWEMQPRNPRDPQMGIFVSASELGGCKVFTYGGRYNLCTEEVRGFIIEKGYQGPNFLEVGMVTDL